MTLPWILQKATLTLGNGMMRAVLISREWLREDFMLNFSLYLPDRVPETIHRMHRVHAEALDILNSIHRNVDKNSAVAEIALTADDGYRLKNAGKIAAYIGMENGYPIGHDISRIKQYYDLGHQVYNACTYKE